MGLRAAWINQKYSVNESVFGVFPAQLLEAKSFYDSSVDNSWGLGPMFSMDTEWVVCNRFFIFGGLEAALIYSQFDVNFSKENVIFEPTNPFLDLYTSTTDKQECLSPQAGMRLGLGWADFVWCDKWFLDFRVTYETQVFWEQNNLQNRFVQGTVPLDFSGNLYLHGLVVSAKLDF